LPPEGNALDHPVVNPDDPGFQHPLTPSTVYPRSYPIELNVGDYFLTPVHPDWPDYGPYNVWIMHIEQGPATLGPEARKVFLCTAEEELIGTGAPNGGMTWWYAWQDYDGQFRFMMDGPNGGIGGAC